MQWSAGTQTGLIPDARQFCPASGCQAVAALLQCSPVQQPALARALGLPSLLSRGRVQVITLGAYRQTASASGVWPDLAVLRLLVPPDRLWLIGYDVILDSTILRSWVLATLVRDSATSIGIQIGAGLVHTVLDRVGGCAARAAGSPTNAHDPLAMPLLHG